MPTGPIDWKAAPLSAIDRKPGAAARARPTQESHADYGTMVDMLLPTLEM